MWRQRPRRKGPLPFRYVFIISFVVFILLTAQGLWIIDRGIRPTLIEIAENETRRIATLAINSAVNRKMAEADMTNLVQYEIDSEGLVRAVNINNQLVNAFATQATAQVDRLLKDVENGRRLDTTIIDDINIERSGDYQGIIAEIPLGVATNTALLSNLGPMIPVKFDLVGNVVTDIESSVVTEPINNIIIDITLTFTVDVDVILPFAIETTEVTTTVPIVDNAVSGDVPDYYNNGSVGEHIQPTIPLSPEKKGKKQNQ